MREKSVTSKALSLSVISCCVRVPNQCKLASNVVIMNPRRLFIARHPLNPSTECQTLQTQRPSWAGALRASPQGSWIKWLSNAYAGHRCRKGVVQKGVWLRVLMILLSQIALTETREPRAQLSIVRLQGIYNS